MYNDLREAGQDVQNPVALLDRATRRSIGKKLDPGETPYLKTKGEIRSLHLARALPIQTMFDIGAFSGLRPGEIRAQRVSDLDLDRRRIQVVRSVKGPVKNNQSRQVPILDALLPLLRVYLAAHPGKGLLFPPTSGRGQFIREHTLLNNLRKALAAAKLPETLTWYSVHTPHLRLPLGHGRPAHREARPHPRAQLCERHEPHAHQHLFPLQGKTFRLLKLTGNW